MNPISRFHKARAGRRVGYPQNEITIAPDGRIFETKTGHEICPLARAPFRIEETPKGNLITFFEKNSNTPYGQAIALKGEQA